MCLHVFVDTRSFLTQSTFGCFPAFMLILHYTKEIENTRREQVMVFLVPTCNEHI